MKLRIKFWLGSCAILMLGVAAKAQDIGAVGGVAGAAGAAPAAAAGPNLFTMLLPPPEMRERCRQKLCKCQIIKLMQSSIAPASAMTGGIIPVGNCCPAVKKEDLAKPAESSEGAAARIKKDVEEAAARREAVRYLGTVDCRYWPEAEEALINALRADRIECVRFEAAIQLQRGCCCTKKIAKALTICIEGTDKDGFPAERSARVQDAAAMALSMCVFTDPVEKKPEEGGGKKQQAKVNPKEFYNNVEAGGSNENVYDSARKVLEKRKDINSTQVISHSHRASQYGLFGILGHAIESSNESMAANPTATREPATREPATAIASATPQMMQTPQRRGLIYKLLPSPNEEPVAIAAPTPPVTTVTTVTPITPVSQPTNLNPARLPSSSEIRPVSATAPATPAAPVKIINGTSKYSSTVDETAVFSTASANNGYNMSIPARVPTTAAPAAMVPASPPAPMTPVQRPTTTSSTTQPRGEQGQLGFVIMDDRK